MEPQEIELYLEQGLLHNLALLSDIGTRAEWFQADANSARAELERWARKQGVRIKTLPPPAATGVDLVAICRDDREQQERLLAALDRGRRGLLVAEFDMPGRLRQLFGPEPCEADRFVLRDTYARMDEIVGKALSYADPEFGLIAAIADPRQPYALASAAPGLLFLNRAIPPTDRGINLSTAVMALVGASSGAKPR